VTTQPKKLIEVALPLPEINDASAYDKMPGIGPHPKGIHHWWARLPLPTARAVLFASVVDDPSSHPEKFPTEEAQNAERERLFGIVRELMQKKLHERPDVYAKAREEMLKHVDGTLPPVLDPFSGGGSIPLEAARLGFEAHAADLNPVAVLLNKCNLEMVPQWLDRPPVNPEVYGNALRRSGWTGAGGLAEDVRYYGNLIRERAIEKIGHLYPKVKLPKEYGEREANVIAWIWARTVASPNPAAQGAHVPLLRSYWLSTKDKSGRAYVEPIINKESLNYELVVKTGMPSGSFDPAKGTVNRNGATCLLTGAAIPFDYIRSEGKAGRIGFRLLAIVAELSRGKAYISPLPSHEDVARSASPDNFPETDVPEKALGFRVQLYGMNKHFKLFSHRQLTAMVTLSDLVKETRQDVVNNARKAGLLETDADEYAKTVTTFLALAVDRCADFNCGLSTWKPSGQQQMHLFTRQAIPMVWDFAEANLLGEKAICWHNAVKLTVDALVRVSVGSTEMGTAHQIDAAGAWNDTRGLLVSTDPPYYDNIGYAALSDFFYVWLRRTIGELYPDLFKTILVPKAPELTAAPERFDGNKERAKEHFESGFRKAFTTLREKMDPRFPLTVYYAFKQEDEKAGSDEDDNGDGEGSSNGVDLTTGWETLLDALLGSGFQITATWPVRASQKWRMVAMGTNALASYIVLACRVRPASAPQCSRREFLNDLKKELPAALKHLQQGNIAPVDLAQAAIGPGMAVFSRYAKVVESSGNPMTVRTALALINQMLDEVLAEQEAEFDADTRWALAWFDQHGTEEGEFGVAETLSRAKNTAVNGLVQAGIVAARGGKVRLVKRNELPEDWDPASDNRLTVWEATQHLIRALDQRGESGAADLLRKMGGAVGETARELSYRLHKVCEGKGWSGEAQAYNSLVLAWPELTSLAQATPSAKQLNLPE
jgi:putative DNA methylase